MHVVAVPVTMILIVFIFLGGFSDMFDKYRFSLTVDLCPSCQWDLKVAVLPLIFYSGLLPSCDLVVETHFKLV